MHLGIKESTNYWNSDLPSYFTFCNRDPSIIDVTEYKVDNVYTNLVHDYGDLKFNDDSLVHVVDGGSFVYDLKECDVASNLYDEAELDDSITNIEASSSLNDQINLIHIHDGTLHHNSGITHNYTCDRFSLLQSEEIVDTVNAYSEFSVIHDGSSYHDGINRTFPSLVEIDGNFYLKAPLLAENITPTTIIIDGGFNTVDQDDSAINGGYPPTVEFDSLDIEANDFLTSGTDNSKLEKLILNSEIRHPVHDFIIEHVITKLELSDRASYGLIDDLDTYKQVPRRMYHDGTFSHDSLNNHYGFDEASFTGKSCWKLVHGRGAIFSIKSISSNGFEYLPGQDPLIWELPAFKALSNSENLNNI